jgi:hypothetical protein
VELCASVTLDAVCWWDGVCWWSNREDMAAFCAEAASLSGGGVGAVWTLAELEEVYVSGPVLFSGAWEWVSSTWSGGTDKACVEEGCNGSCEGDMFVDVLWGVRYGVRRDAQGLEGYSKNRVSEDTTGKGGDV